MHVQFKLCLLTSTVLSTVHPRNFALGAFAFILPGKVDQGARVSLACH